MYKCINGWTKDKMKKQIKKNNNGTCSYDSNRSLCFYLNPIDNNRCAVGCFIPDGHPGLSVEGTAIELFNDYEDLKEGMPLSLTGMMKFQSTHDFNKEGNMHEILCNWIDKNVRDSK